MLFRPRSILSQCGVAVAALALHGCTPSPRPNLLMIVSDALRADALSCYGGPAQTPHICGLAERGVLFENAYSNASWTLPSAVSMFTGRYSSSYATARGDGEGWQSVYYVNGREVLLAEALRDEGYEVVAFVDNRLAAQANALQGFSEPGFDRFRVMKDVGAIEQAVGIDTTDSRYRRVLPVLQLLLDPGERNFFVLQWMYDPHATYNPPERLLRRLEGDLEGLPRPLSFYLGLGHKEIPEGGLHKLKEYARTISEAERRALRRLYDKEVESVDERVGYVLRALELRGLRDETIVVFTADHGEAFGEHGAYLHGTTYFGEVVRVPLILAGPGIAKGERVAEPVSHVDLMPTLRDALRVDCLHGAPGRSFEPLLRGRGAAGEAREQYIVGIQGREYADALVSGRYKLITSEGTEVAKLFDLVADPGERKDVAAEHHDVAKRMMARILAFRSGNRATPEDPALLEKVDRDTREPLEDLGYLD